MKLLGIGDTYFPGRDGTGRNGTVTENNPYRRRAFMPGVNHFVLSSSLLRIAKIEENICYYYLGIDFVIND